MYLIHWPNPEIPVKETLNAMNKLLEMGLIKNICVSNFNTAGFMGAMNNIKTGKIIAYEVEYNTSCGT